jgi:hypothetical protein
VASSEAGSTRGWSRYLPERLIRWLSRHGVSDWEQDARQEPFVVPAELQLRLTTRETGKLISDLQGLSFVRVWVGTLTSDWIRFPGDCHPDR